MDIGGEPMIKRVVDRARRAAVLDRVLVATTTDTADDKIEGYCGSRQIPTARGSQFDVLDRYHSAARAAQADVVVRLTADCPLIDGGMIDEVVGVLTGMEVNQARPLRSGGTHRYDFAANRLPPPWKRTYPIGLDIEVCTFNALERAWHEAHEMWDREHVMPYMYEGVSLAPVDRRLSSGTSPRQFRIALLNNETDLGSYRWTVDTPEDLEFVRQVYGRFGGRNDFSWYEVLALVRSDPQLAKINAGIRHKTLRDTDQRSAADGAA
jgi:spore coat polysaccharide biosynthesis protein SpsF